MKLFLFTTLLLSPLARAEDASMLPWDRYAVEEDPVAAVKLLLTVKVGHAESMFRAPIPQCGNEFDALQVKVADSDVTVRTFGLHFADGTSREFTVNKTYRSGTDSGWISLGLFRAMDSRCPVDVYATAKSSGTATVSVYGRTR